MLPDRVDDLHLQGRQSFALAMEHLFQECQPAFPGVRRELHRHRSGMLLKVFAGELGCLKCTLSCLVNTNTKRFGQITGQRRTTRPVFM